MDAPSSHFVTSFTITSSGGAILNWSEVRLPRQVAKTGPLHHFFRLFVCGVLSRLSDRDSQVPLLSVPPNVTFLEGLTPDHVKDGPPLWAGQARHRRMLAAKAAKAAKAATPGAVSEEGVGDTDDHPVPGGQGGGNEDVGDLPQAPKIGGARKTGAKQGGPERMQVS